MIVYRNRVSLVRFLDINLPLEQKSKIQEELFQAVPNDLGNQDLSTML